MKPLDLASAWRHVSRNFRRHITKFNLAARVTRRRVRHLFRYRRESLVVRTITKRFGMEPAPMNVSLRAVPRKIIKLRRVAPLAFSAVLGAAVVAAGTGVVNGSDHIAFTQSAHATPVDASTISAPSGFAALVAKVEPAVISVRVKMEQPLNGTPMSDEIPVPPNTPMWKFFQQYGFPGFPNFMPQGKEVIIGEGSGFFISPDGYAVTNNHVVEDAKTVQVKTYNGNTYRAKVIGRDPKTDLALIKVDSNKTFPYVKFADHPPRVGSWVVAVGNPFGLSETVTAGIVSARGRDINAGTYDNYIQIDAPINKGNSGGPAFNMKGRVIGVNTAIISPNGGSVGIGFDIPASTAKRVIAQLKAHGYVNHAFLGVQVQPVTAGIAHAIGLKKVEGALVDEPVSGSPAAKAGIKTGDVITAVNGKPMKSAHDLARTIGMMAPGTKVKVSFLHDGEHRVVTVTLSKWPGEKTAMNNTGENHQAGNSVPHIGLTLEPASAVAGAGNKGVAVVGVDPNGPAAQQGLQPGDVILDVGGKAVSNVNDVRDALRQAKAKGRRDVLMRVKTANSSAHFIAVPIVKHA